MFIFICNAIHEVLRDRIASIVCGLFTTEEEMPASKTQKNPSDNNGGTERRSSQREKNKTRILLKSTKESKISFHHGSTTTVKTLPEMLTCYSCPLQILFYFSTNIYKAKMFHIQSLS